MNLVRATGWGRMAASASTPMAAWSGDPRWASARGRDLSTLKRITSRSARTVWLCGRGRSCGGGLRYEGARGNAPNSCSPRARARFQRNRLRCGPSSFEALPGRRARGSSFSSRASRWRSSSPGSSRPAEFGLAAMVLVLSGLVVVVGDAGLGAALVQRRVITDEDKSTVFWTSLGIGVGSRCRGGSGRPGSELLRPAGGQAAPDRAVDLLPHRGARHDPVGAPRAGDELPRARVAPDGRYGRGRSRRHRSRLRGLRSVGADRPASCHRSVLDQLPLVVLPLGAVPSVLARRACARSAPSPGTSSARTSSTTRGATRTTSWSAGISGRRRSARTRSRTT